MGPAGEPEAVDNRHLAADEPEEDPGWRGPRVEAEVDWRIHRLLPDCLQLAPAEPRQEPHHQGLWSPHDLLQVRHETREEDVRNGSCTPGLPPSTATATTSTGASSVFQLTSTTVPPSPSWSRPKPPPRRRSSSTTSSSTTNCKCCEQRPHSEE